MIAQHLNRSAIKRLEPVKISHKGNIDKTHWSVDTNDMKAVSSIHRLLIYGIPHHLLWRLIHPTQIWKSWRFAGS